MHGEIISHECESIGNRRPCSREYDKDLPQYEVGGASEHHAADALWWSFHKPGFGASWIHLVENYLHLPLGI